MPQTALPNLGLNYDYLLGQDGWLAGMNNNLAVLDNMAQLAYITVEAFTVSSAPASPSNGSGYIIGGTGGAWLGRTTGELAFYYTNTGWHYVSPREGMLCYDRAVDRLYQYDGSDWFTVRGYEEITVSTALTINRTTAVDLHLDLTSDKTITIPQNSTTAFPIGTKFRFTNISTASPEPIVSFNDQGAVTWRGESPPDDGFELWPDSWIEIQKIGTDEWIVVDMSARGIHNTNVNGFATTVNVDIDWQRQGDQVELDFDTISAVSNATSKVTATALPVHLRGATGKRIINRVKDDNAASFSIANANVASNGIITFYPDLNSANTWTSSGSPEPVATIAGFQGGYARNI